MGPASSGPVWRVAWNSCCVVGMPNSRALARMFSMGSGSACVWPSFDDEVFDEAALSPPQPTRPTTESAKTNRENFTSEIIENLGESCRVRGSYKRTYVTMTPRKAFTLIELLVVIAIIAIL